MGAFADQEILRTRVLFFISTEGRNTRLVLYIPEALLRYFKYSSLEMGVVLFEKDFKLDGVKILFRLTVRCDFQASI